MKKTQKIVFAFVAACLLSSIPFAATATSGTSVEISQSLVPKICPADPGKQAVSELPAKSSPIVLPARKPNAAVPAKDDMIETPSVSLSGGLKRTSAPVVNPVPVPEAMKKPITLDQALEVAFSNSPQIQTALSMVESARGAVDAARAQFNPTFNVSMTSTFQGPISKMSTGDGSFISMGSSPDNLANLSFTLPLDVSRKLTYSSDIATYQFQQDYLSMVSTSQQLIVDVKSAYYELLRTCGKVAVNQASVDDAKLRLDNIRAKFEEGAAPKYDVTSAEVELDNLNQELISSQNDMRVAQASLNAVLGVDVNNPTQVVSGDIDVSNEEVDIPKLVNEAYSKRPEIKSAQLQVTLAQVDVSLKKTGVLPSLNLSGGPSYDFNPSGFTTKKTSWSVGVTLSVPVWDGGVTKANVRESKAQLQGAIASLNQEKIAVAKEVRKSALDLQNSALRTKTTEHAVKLAEDALAIAYDRYNSGVAVLVEVTNAQSQLAQARYNFVNAQYDYAIAVAQFQKATYAQPELNQLQLLAGKTVEIAEAKK